MHIAGTRLQPFQSFIGLDWLSENGVEVIDLANQECTKMLAQFIQASPDLWREDIGEG